MHPVAVLIDRGHRELPIRPTTSAAMCPPPGEDVAVRFDDAHHPVEVRLLKP